MLTKAKVKEFLKCANDYKYFKNHYLMQDCNTDALTFICWILLCKSNNVIAYLTDFQKNGEQLIKTIHRFLDNVPKWMRAEFKYNNNSGFKLENGNRFCVISDQEKSQGLMFDYVIVNSFTIVDRYKNLFCKQINCINHNYNRRIIYLV